MIRNVTIILGRMLTFYLFGFVVTILAVKLGWYSLYLLIAIILFVLIAWSWDNEIQ